jgi:hypothetical protein
VRRTLWLWLKERGYASESDDGVLERFLVIVGCRDVHLRPALRLHRRWPADEAKELEARGELVAAVRNAVNAVRGG